MILNMNSLRTHVNMRNNPVPARRFTYGRNSFSPLANLQNRNLNVRNTDKLIKDELTKNKVPADVKFSLQFDREKGGFTLTGVSDEKFSPLIKKSLETVLGIKFAEEKEDAKK